MSTEIIKYGGVTVEFSPAAIVADFPAMQRKLAERLAPYDGLDAEGVRHMDLKQAKSCRAELRAMSKDLNDARKAIKRVYTTPLTQFEENVGELDALILEPIEILDGVVKEREEQERAARYAALEEHYQAFAGDLALVLPFERIFEKPWTNKTGWTYDEEEGWRCPKHFEQIEATVVKLADNWECLQRRKDTLYDFESTKVHFFQVLDLGQALEYDRQQHEARKAIEELQRVEEPEPEPKAPQTANDGPSAPVPIATESPEFPEPDAPREWRIRFTATYSQWNQLVGAMDAIGITDRARLEKRNG